MQTSPCQQHHDAYCPNPTLPEINARPSLSPPHINPTWSYQSPFRPPLPLPHFPPSPPLTRRQTAQQPPQPPHHHRLPLPIHRRLIPRIAHTHTNPTPLGAHHLRLRRQLLPATNPHIRLREQPHINPAQHPLKLPRIAALFAHLREVHIQPHILREVRLPLDREGVHQLRRQLRVQPTPQRDRVGVKWQRPRASTGEGDGGDPCDARGVDRGADGAGEVYGEVEVGTDVGAGDGEVRESAGPELRPDEGDAVAHGGDGEGVHPVEARGGQVGADGVRGGGAAGVLAGGGARDGVEVG